MSAKTRKSVTIELTEALYLDSADGIFGQEWGEQVTGYLYPLSENIRTVAYEIKPQGFGRRVVKTLKFRESQLKIVSLGDVHLREQYTLDKWDTFQVFYDGRSLIFKTFTKDLNFKQYKDWLLIELRYELYSGDQFLGRYRKNWEIK